jgi:MFS family permease
MSVSEQDKEQMALEKEKAKKAKVEAKEIKRSAAEKKELARLEKEKAKPKRKTYFWYLIVILCLIYIVDEVTTSLPNEMQPEISLEFFQNGMGLSENQGISKLKLMETLANALLVIGFFWKALADRYGRKPFLIANTIGMVGGLLLCFWSQGLWMYILGFFVIRFFVTPDEQIVYIFETAPEKKRATIFSAVKGIAELGLLLIPLGRKALMKDDPTLWRLTFLIPACIGLVASLAICLCARETDAFLDSRIAYLKLTPEQREAIALEKKEASKKQGGFFSAFAYSIKNHQLRWIFIVTLMFTLSRTITSDYTNILSQAGYSTAQRSNALLIFPITCAAIVFAYGFLSDKIGRKITSIVLLSTATVSLLLLYFGAMYQWNEWLLGAFIGLFLGAYWSNGDTYMLMAGESCPTNMRASVMSAWTAAYGVGMVLSMLIGTLVVGKLPDGNWQLGLFCILLAVPFFVLSIFFLMGKVKETKGAHLEDALTGEKAA